MRGKLLIVIATVALAGCTSDHGALPPPTNKLSQLAPEDDGVADRALLSPADLPNGFGRVPDPDLAGRWAAVVDEVATLTPLRPGCADELDAIHSLIEAPPDDSAGAEFTDGERSIVQFTGRATNAAANDLVRRIADLNAHCDAYTLQVADRGSLDMTVRPRAVATSSSTAITAWDRKLMSAHLRQTETRVAIATSGVVSLFGITGEPSVSEAELANVIDAAVRQAREAAR